MSHPSHPDILHLNDDNPPFVVNNEEKKIAKNAVVTTTTKLDFVDADVGLTISTKPGTPIHLFIEDHLGDLPDRKWPITAKVDLSISEAEQVVDMLTSALNFCRTRAT